MTTSGYAIMFFFVNGRLCFGFSIFICAGLIVFGVQVLGFLDFFFPVPILP